MEWLRGMVGMVPPKETQQQQKYTSNPEETRATLLARQQQQIMIDEAKLEDVNERINAAVKGGRANEVKRLLQERNRLQESIRLQQGKMHNLVETQQVLASADENLIQAQLMKQGAGELDTIQKQTEDIDLDQVVDRYRSASQETTNISRRLADPFDSMAGLESDETGMDVDTELQLLMQQAQDEKDAQMQTMPTVPVSIPAASTKQQTSATRRTTTKPTSQGKDD